MAPADPRETDGGARASRVRVRLVDQPAALWWSLLYFFSLLCGYYVLRPVRDAMGSSGDALTVFLAPTANNPAGRIDSYLPKVILAEPVERKFLKALKNSDIEAVEFDAQLDEGVREGWITADERKQLEELRAMTLDAITVDDFEAWELRAASFERLAGIDDSRAAA